MRTALAATGLLLLAACSSAPDPAPAPAGTTSSAPVTTTTAALTKLAPLWENRLPALSPRGMCPTEATFTPGCTTAILDFRKTVEEISDQAARLGGRYSGVRVAAAEVVDAIEEWTTVCVTSTPGTSERIRCLKPLNRVLNGDTLILAAIHEVESP
jgi:hypothetical protein